MAGTGAEAVQVVIRKELYENMDGIRTRVRFATVLINGADTGKEYFENLTFSQKKTLVTARILRLTKEQAKVYASEMSAYLKSISPDADIWD